MTIIQRKVVLITGGASGIGKLMGQLVLERGCRHLVIFDINQSNLQQTKIELEKQGFNNHEGHIVDVCDRHKVAELVSQIRSRLGSIDILINNAGIVVGKTFVEHSHEDIERTLAVNVSSLMHLAKCVLPSMLANNEGHIVNISSAASLVANPRMSVYCASKWAVTGWSDSLRLEMRQAKSKVQVTTVMPYYIDTGMFAGTRSPVLPILKPAPTAHKIIRAIETNRAFLRMPHLLNYLPLLRGTMPYQLFDFVVGRLFGIYRSMDHFVGRR